MFWHVSVHLFTPGGTPARSRWGRGVPQPGADGGTLARSRWGGTPARSQQGGGTPTRSRWWVPWPGPDGGYLSQIQGGYPLSWPGWGTPSLPGGTLPWVPPLAPGWGTPPSGPGRVTQLNPGCGTPHLGVPRWVTPSRDGVPPGKARMGGTQGGVSLQGWVPLSQVRTGVPEVGYPPPGMGYPPARSGRGVPEVGYPPPGMGYPPPPPGTGQ